MAPVTAAAELPQPIFPTSFYGNVTVNDAPAPAGTLVTGKIVDAAGSPGEGSIRVATAGRYGGPDGLDDKLTVQTDNPSDAGKTIEFWVKLPYWKNAILADETAGYDSTPGHRLDLNATGDGGVIDGGGSGGGGGSEGVNTVASFSEKTITVSVFGTTAGLSISPDGVVLNTVTFTAPDGKMTITIPEGTIAKDAEGNPLGSLSWSENTGSPPPPSGAHIAVAFDLEPGGVTFAPPITFIYHYDPSKLPPGIEEESLALAFYDVKSGKWVNLAGTVDTAADTITALIPHFTTFAVIGYPKPAPIKEVTPTPEAAPAAFSLASLTIQPEKVKCGEKVTVSVAVSNTGGKEGNYSVALMVNGIKDQEKSVTIPAGGQQTVTFEIIKDQPGNYNVTIGTLNGIFTVEALPTTIPPVSLTAVTEPFNWTLAGGIIGAVAVIALFTVLWARRKGTV